MSKFKFRLEKVLDYKETVEGHKKSIYGEINRELNEQTKVLNDFYDAKTELVKNKDGSRTTNIANLKLFNNYIGEISKNIERQEEIVEETKVRLSTAQKELIEAVQEKKSFEKLKEKDYEEYIVESKKDEAKIIDEIVTFKNGLKE